MSEMQTRLQHIQEKCSSSEKVAIEVQNTKDNEIQCLKAKNHKLKILLER